MLTFESRRIREDPDALVQIARIVADGGTIVDRPWLCSIIRSLKVLGIYSSCKFLADANFGVKKDGAGAVSKLYDISGNNNDAVQATGANQPIWSVGVQNGKAGLLFNGTSSILDGTSGLVDSGGAACTVIAGIKSLDLTGSNSIIEMGNAHTNLDDYYMILSANGAVYQSNIANDRSTANGTISINTFYEIAWVLTGGAFSTSNPAFFVNGASKASTQGIGTDTPTINPTKFRIGAYYFVPASQFMDGYINWVYTFNIALSTAQRQAMENLLNSYYAIY